MPTERTRIGLLQSQNGGQIEVLQYRLNYVDSNGDPDVKLGFNGHDWEMVVVKDDAIVFQKVFTGDTPGKAELVAESGLFIQKELPVSVPGTFDDLAEQGSFAEWSEEDAARTAARRLLHRIRGIRHDVNNFLAGDSPDLLNNGLRDKIVTASDGLKELVILLRN